MGFTKTSLVLFLFFILLSPYYATSRITHQQRLPSTTKFSPNQQVEQLKRSFNLVQKDFVPGEIVEKFSFFDDSAGAPVENLGHHAGYYSLPLSIPAWMFFLFIESENGPNAPLMLWVSCASEFDLLLEIGPVKINNDLSLSRNDYGWDKEANIIFVDRCTRTGYSYSSDKNDNRTSEIDVRYMSDFMQAFYKKRPQFIKNAFYIAGESYAGQYIPALASWILEGNKNKEGNSINLKGIAIGNGWTNPRIQFQAYAKYAFDNKLITKEDLTDINKLVLSCMDAITTCENEGGDSCQTALNQCNQILPKIQSIAGNVNPYDIRKTCEGSMCYNFSNVVTFLKKKAVKDALGVGNREFVPCSNAVPNALNQYSMRNSDVYIPALLEDGIKVLIYAGEYDLICNWLGNSQWVHAMKWSGQEQFGASETVSFLVEGKTAGLLNSYGPLSFLKVNDAGHLVPMDQPKVALKMLVNWMQGT